MFVVDSYQWNKVIQPLVLTFTRMLYYCANSSLTYLCILGQHNSSAKQDVILPPTGLCISDEVTVIYCDTLIHIALS